LQEIGGFIMADVPVWIPIVSAVAGNAIVGVINFAMRRQDRKAEEKRHLRELLFKSAVEEWKQHFSFAIEANKATGTKTFVQPLLSYMVHQMKLSDVFLEGKITKENLSAKLVEVSEVMEELKKYVDQPKTHLQDRDK
jgi:hypothetical protein